MFARTWSSSIGISAMSEECGSEGLPFAAMTGPQRDLLLRLLAEYVHNADPAIARPRLARIEETGLDRIHVDARRLRRGLFDVTVASLRRFATSGLRSSFSK
jgi:hypothetical protein